MNLRCRPFCPNEYVTDADLILLEITPEDASRILTAMKKSREFLSEMCRNGFPSHTYGGVSFPSTLGFILFGTNSAFLEAIAERIHEDCWVMLPDEFDPEAACILGNSENLTRCECFRMMVYQTSVSISALSKFGDDRFESCDLSADLLGSIAAGEEPKNIEFVDAGAIRSHSS